MMNSNIQTCLVYTIIALLTSTSAVLNDSIEILDERIDDTQTDLEEAIRGRTQSTNSKDSFDLIEIIMVSDQEGDDLEEYDDVTLQLIIPEPETEQIAVPVPNIEYKRQIFPDLDLEEFFVEIAPVPEIELSPLPLIFPQLKFDLEEEQFMPQIEPKIQEEIMELELEIEDVAEPSPEIEPQGEPSPEAELDIVEFIEELLTIGTIFDINKKNEDVPVHETFLATLVMINAIVAFVVAVLWSFLPNVYSSTWFWVAYLTLPILAFIAAILTYSQNSIAQGYMYLIGVALLFVSIGTLVVTSVLMYTIIRARLQKLPIDAFEVKLTIIVVVYFILSIFGLILSTFVLG